MKLVDISGTKSGNILKDKINEIATQSKNKNIRGLYSGINEFKKSIFKHPVVCHIKQSMYIKSVSNATNYFCFFSTFT
jgi:hypothetical protein